MRDGGWQKGGKSDAKGPTRPVGGGRPPSAPRRSPQELLALKIEEVQRAGLPLNLAREVALGRRDLNEVLKKMAQVDEVARLMSKHDIDKALATQVVLGKVNLDAVLRRRRIAAHINDNRGRDALVEACAGGEWVLGIHGRELLRCRLLAVRPYEIVVADVERGEERVIHKTAVKFLATTEVWAKARKAMVWDTERKKREVEPILRPQDRYGCSNGRLGESWADAATVRVTLAEGERFVGQVASVARWDFGLATRGGTVFILRHALADFGDQD
jgi:hypothetical protein